MPASRRDEEDDDPRPRRRKAEPEPEEDDEVDEDEDLAPVKKKKKKKLSKKERIAAKAKTATYLLWGGGAVGGLVVLGIIIYIAVSSYVPAAATMHGADWYKAKNTLNRFDFLFPGGVPSHDLVTLRNPATDVKVRAELWQRKYKGRMYEACYISGDNVTAGNINGAAQNMKSAPPTDLKAKSSVAEIVLNDGARCIVMRVYGSDQFDKDDPMVQFFFQSFKLTS